jgi:hypothetical protein
MRSKVDFPEPERPSRTDDLAAAQRKIDGFEHPHFARTPRETAAYAVNRQDRVV